MIKILSLLFPILLFSQMLKVEDSVHPIILSSQHDKKYTLVENGIWVITWDKESTRMANKYFANNYMHEDINLIVDVSQAPSGILSLFILPDMRKYSHPILLSYDETYNLTLPYKDKNLTIIRIKDRQITNINYCSTQNELKNLLK